MYLVEKRRKKRHVSMQKRIIRVNYWIKELRKAWITFEHRARGEILYLLPQTVIWVFFYLFHCPLQEIWQQKAALPTLVSVCSIFLCPNIGMAASVNIFNF